MVGKYDIKEELTPAFFNCFETILWTTQVAHSSRSLMEMMRGNSGGPEAKGGEALLSGGKLARWQDLL